VIHAHAILGDLPQDLAFKPDTRSCVVIGDRVTIRENVTIHRGTKPDTMTEVGDDCFLMIGAHLAHNVKVGRRAILVNNCLLAGYVEIGEGAIISGCAVIHQFTKVGRLAMLSGLSGIGKDVPPFCVCAGLRRNEVAGLNIVGMRRAGIGTDQRKQVKRAFDLLYRSSLNFRDVPAAIRAEFIDGPALEIADFVAASKRGICPYRGGTDEEAE
jgi:UDP-N-acetylglucosamine acyltransferase